MMVHNLPILGYAQPHPGLSREFHDLGTIEPFEKDNPLPIFGR